MFGKKNTNKYLTWLKIVFWYFGTPKRILLIFPTHPPLVDDLENLAKNIR